MKKFSLYVLVVFFLIMALSASFAADNDFTTVNPKWTKHWWVDITAGYSEFAFTNANLQSGFHARRVTTGSTSFRGELGFNFNRYCAIALSLMRGAYWVQYHGILEDNDWHSVWNNLFGLTLRSTVPLSESVGLYGEGGLGYISRHGFDINGVTAIKDATVLTPMLGAGFIFNVWKDLFIDLDTVYALPNAAKNQPQTWYGGLGIFYLLGSSPVPASEMTYWFPRNFIQLDYMNRDLFYANVAGSIYLPIFFKGDISVKQGLSFIYEKTFFHTSKNFSLEMGASGGYWASNHLSQNFTTLTLFPEIKLWLVRCPRFDLYITYSLAGLTFISRNWIDNQKTGTNFTFQDFMGIGAFLGRSKQFNLNIQIMHFSNGNLFPQNPGIDVPLMFGLGYAF